MSRNKLILVGGGGHCKSCIDVIEQEGHYEIVGILDIPSKNGMQILGYEIIGTDDDYEKFHQQGCTFLITVGQIKTAALRKKIFEKLNKINANFATIIAPTATVSKHAMIGKGTIVMHHAFVNAGTHIGENCILNSGCNIEHDVAIGQHCHISTGAYVNGDCQIGDEVFIGSNATLANLITIGNQVVIGAGALIVKSTGNNQTWVGIPAKKITA